MKEYCKPTAQPVEVLAEGVYASSGDPADSAVKSLKCDSKYMKGVWQNPDYSDWAGGTRGYKQQFGCLGCPANTGSGCGLLTHYPESGNAASYDVDNGNRMPSWERKGYGPNAVVSDWNM